MPQATSRSTGTAPAIRRRMLRIIGWSSQALWDGAAFRGGCQSCSASIVSLSSGRLHPRHPNLTIRVSVPGHALSDAMHELVRPHEHGGDVPGDLIVDRLLQLALLRFVEGGLHLSEPGIDLRVRILDA